MHGYYRGFLAILRALGIALAAVAFVLLIWGEVILLNTLLNN